MSTEQALPASLFIYVPGENTVNEGAIVSFEPIKTGFFGLFTSDYRVIILVNYLQYCSSLNPKGKSDNSALETLYKTLEVKTCTPQQADMYGCTITQLKSISDESTRNRLKSELRIEEKRVKTLKKEAKKSSAAVDGFQSP